MLIIGELINCTRKKVGEAAEKRDEEFFRDLARKQASAGAPHARCERWTSAKGSGTAELAGGLWCRQW